MTDQSNQATRVQLGEPVNILLTGVWVTHTVASVKASPAWVMTHESWDPKLTAQFAGNSTG